MCILTESWRCKLRTYRRLWVGFSGGLDSTVLLHLLLNEPALLPKLHVVHVHHGISPNADAWLWQTKAFCVAHHLPYKAVRVQLKDTSNLEESARKARFEVFQRHVDTHDCLLLAHHQDDRAETLLLQLFRGTGIDGLASMQALRPFGQGFLARPLLEEPRAALEDYAKKHALTWVQDESNHNTHFSRNFIRHEIMPLVASRWPKASQKISECAQHAVDARHDLNALAYLDCPELELHQTHLELRALKDLTSSRLKRVLRAWLQHQSVCAPSREVLRRLIQDVILAQADANPVIRIDDISVRRYRGVLYAERKLPTSEVEQLSWDAFPNPLKHRGRIFSAEAAEAGLHVPEGCHVSIRFRQGGEKIRINGQTKSLKKLFQTWGVPPWQRDTIPLIYIDDVLSVVLDFAIADDYYKAQGLRLYSISVSVEERMYDAV